MKKIVMPFVPSISSLATTCIVSSSAKQWWKNPLGISKQPDSDILAADWFVNCKRKLKRGDDIDANYNFK